MDAFELHRIQKEANRKRIRKDQHLNVYADPLKRATNPEFPKISSSDLSNRNKAAKNQGTPYKRVPLGRIDTNSGGSKQVRDMVMKLHRQTQAIPRPREKTSVPISQLIPKLDRVSEFKRNGYNNRYLQITKDILQHLPQESGPSPVDQATKYIGTFVNWFKLHRYDYVVVNKDIEGISLDSQTSKPKEVSLTHPISGKLDTVTTTAPTHVALSSTMIGKFLLSVQVKSIHSESICIVMLAQTDIRFSVENNDLLILPPEMMCYRVIMGRRVAFCMKWQVIKKSAIDIDFFD